VCVFVLIDACYRECGYEVLLQQTMS